MTRPDRRRLLVTTAGCAIAGVLSCGGARAASTATQTLVIEPDQGLNAIYALVNAAKSTIDMTMYELVDTTAQTDLCNAAKRGVTVRVILDTNLEKSNNTAAYDQLQGCGVNVVYAWTKYAATHQKTITVDGATSSARSAVMTLNLTSRYYSTTRDFAIIETDAADIAAIEKTFASDYTHSTITPPVGDALYWSPTNAQTAMLAAINGAKKTLLVENEEMSDTAIVDALETAARNGIDVTIVMTNDDNDYSSEFDALKSAGAHVGTYRDTSTGLYIHAKVILADDGAAGQVALVGSENFSKASLTENRELGLATTDATVIAGLEKTLQTDYSGSTPW